MPNSMTHKPMKTHSLHANKIDIQDMALFGITYSYERVFLGCNGIIQRPNPQPNYKSVFNKLANLNIHSIACTPAPHTLNGS